MTQFGRALHELNIDILCANAPQAKGRVDLPLNAKHRTHVAPLDRSLTAAPP